MTFYERTNVAENYLAQVAGLLADRYHISTETAQDAVAASDLTAAIHGCPYIAMHYPAAKAADIVANTTLHTSPTFAHATI